MLCVFFSHETLKREYFEMLSSSFLFFLPLTDVSTFHGFQNAALTRRWNSVWLRSSGQEKKSDVDSLGKLV